MASSTISTTTSSIAQDDKDDCTIYCIDEIKKIQGSSEHINRTVLTPFSTIYARGSKEFKEHFSRMPAPLSLPKSAHLAESTRVHMKVLKSIMVKSQGIPPIVTREAIKKICWVLPKNTEERASEYSFITGRYYWGAHLTGEERSFFSDIMCYVEASWMRIHRYDDPKEDKSSLTIDQEQFVNEMASVMELPDIQAMKNAYSCTLSRNHLRLLYQELTGQFSENPRLEDTPTKRYRRMNIIQFSIAMMYILYPCIPTNGLTLAEEIDLLYAQLKVPEIRSKFAGFMTYTQAQNQLFVNNTNDQMYNEAGAVIMFLSIPRIHPTGEKASVAWHAFRLSASFINGTYKEGVNKGWVNLWFVPEDKTNPNPASLLERFEKLLESKINNREREDGYRRPPNMEGKDTEPLPSVERFIRRVNYPCPVVKDSHPLATLSPAAVVANEAAAVLANQAAAEAKAVSSSSPSTGMTTALSSSISSTTTTVAASIGTSDSKAAIDTLPTVSSNSFFVTTTSSALAPEKQDNSPEKRSFT